LLALSFLCFVLQPAFQNLKQRVENYVNALLSTETWAPSLNKNQLRMKVRSSVMR